MNHNQPERWHRWFDLRMSLVLILSVFMLVVDGVRIEAQTINKFVVSYFTSFRESASNRPGATTAAMTAISFFNVSSMQCDVSVLWNFKGGGSCQTQTDANSIPPLQPNESIIHCSRSINTLSGSPSCSEFCNAPDTETLEGFARISVQAECIDHIGIDAQIYYTVFDGDMVNETILSIHKPEVYRFDSDMPSRIE